MKKYILFIFIVLGVSATVLFFIQAESKAENCCAKCTGSSSCRACKNCKYCAHCNSGGSCGVCSYSDPEPVKKSPVVAPPSKTTSVSTSSGNSFVNSLVYVVNSKTLNVRKEPSTTGIILCTCKQGEVLVVLEIVNDKWAKVKVNGITGFVFKQYISKK